jgi:NADH-quinone oxidoreductase subunit A
MEQSQLMQYLPVAMLGLLAVAFSFGTLVLSVVVGKKGKRLPIKDTAYECGMLPIGESGSRMSVKFYLVAMLFILFDIEVVFLYPWAVVYKEMLKTNANPIFGSMLSFLGVLLVGYIYAVKKQAFDWKS